MRRIPPHRRLYVYGPLFAAICVCLGFGYLALVNHFSATSATGDPLPTVIKVKGHKVIVTKRVRVPGKTKRVHGKTVFVPAHTEVITTTHFVPGAPTILTGPTHTTTRTVGSTIFQTVTGPTTTTVRTVTGPTTTQTQIVPTTIISTITGPTITTVTTITTPPPPPVTSICTVDTNGVTLGCS